MDTGNDCDLLERSVGRDVTSVAVRWQRAFDRTGHRLNAERPFLARVAYLGTLRAESWITRVPNWTRLFSRTRERRLYRIDCLLPLTAVL